VATNRGGNSESQLRKQIVANVQSAMGAPLYARIDNDDCFSMLPRIEAGSIDLVLIDPPYNISKQTTGFKNGGFKQYQITHDFGEWDYDFQGLDKVIAESYRVLRSGGTLIVFGSLWNISHLHQDMAKAGFKQIRFIEWIKPNPTPINSTRNYLTNAREVALVAVKGRNPTFHSKYDNGTYHFATHRGDGRFHTTPKPVGLIKALIEKHSNPGDVVLDCFSGSGTTALASMETGRHFVGCELDPNYWAKSHERLVRHAKSNQIILGGPVAQSPAIASVNAHGVITTPDGRHVYEPASGKVAAEVSFAQLDGQWCAEYRFRFQCGDFQGSTLPISVQSSRFASRDEAVANAARRLADDAKAKCGEIAGLSKVQSKALIELLAWTDSLIVVAKAVQPAAGLLAGKRFIDAFAGIGGMHLGFSQLGAQCVAVIEIDPAAQAVYRANHGDGLPIFDDISSVDAKLLPKAEILCGGFPCMSFSLAGKQDGFASSQHGQLFFEIVRLAGEARPELILLENVAAFATHDHGRTADQALSSLASIGYSVSMQVLNAARFGVPQQRERLFMVAVRLDLIGKQAGPFKFPQGSDPGIVVADILERGITDGVCKAEMTTLAANDSQSADGLIRVGSIGGRDMQGYRVYSPSGKGATLCASSGGPGRQTGLYLVDGQPRRLTPRECARMQGFPDSFQLHAKPDQARKQFGNAVPVPVIKAIATEAANQIFQLAA
jgi:DNA (cytosine-5)-methyltransferase 1